MSETRPKLTMALADHRHTQALKSGAVRSDLFALQFPAIKPIHKAFAPMARTQTFDISEMAIVTFLQAIAYNKPLVMLPVAVASRLQQGCMVYDKRFYNLTPEQLPGKKVGVRAYSQTTGAWLRGILADTYKVPLEEIDWIVFDGAHLAEYTEPHFVRRAAPEQNMLEMLKSGELAAAIYGFDLPDDPDLKPVVPDPAQADAAWYKAHGFVPVNHVVVMKRDLAEENPQIFKDLYTLLQRSIAAAEPYEPALSRPASGINALSDALRMIIGLCDAQQLLPRKVTLEEVLAPARRLLGDAAL